MSLFIGISWHNNIGIARNGEVAENRTVVPSTLLCLTELKAPQFRKEEGGKEWVILLG